MKILSPHSATRFAGAVACALLALGGLSARADLSEGLVGYWPFDVDLEDKSESDPPAHGVGKTWAAGGNDNLDGLASNEAAEATYVEGKFGQSVKFADDFYVETPVELEDRFDFGSIVGADQDGEDPDDPDEAPDRPGFTISAWITVDEFASNWQCIAGKGEQQQWRIHRRAATNMLTGNGGNGDTPEGDFEAEPGSGTWHHIVLRSDLDNDMASFWVDGVMNAENSGLNPQGNIMPMLIGQNPDTGNRTWRGNIDDFATWNRPLTDEEIAELWAGGAGTSVETALDPSDPNVSGAKSIVLRDVLPESDQAFEIRIGNTGDTQPLVISNVALSGADMGNFTIVDSPTEIAPDSNGVINMTFNGAQDLGTFNATVTYTTNDPDADDQTVEVALTALVPNAEGPEAHYRFDESDAALAAADSTANLRAGKYDEGPAGSINLASEGLSGAEGTSLTVSGGGLAEAPTMPVGDFTVSLFFQPSSLGDAASADLRTLFGQGDSSPEFGLLEASGALHWFGEEDVQFSTDQIIEPGTTYHVAITYDRAAQAAAIILDGVEVASGTVAAPGPDGAFYIGAFGPDNALGFEGTLDDLQFYSRVLSIDEELAYLRENPGQVLTPFALGQDPDSDLDGISDRLELSEYMTDPQNPDTDGDGLTDGDEIARSTDPLSTDTDGDGFSDSAEVEGGFDPTDPNVPDNAAILADVADPVLFYEFNEGSGDTTANTGTAGGVGTLTNAHAGAWVAEGGVGGSGYLNFNTDGPTGLEAQYVATGLGPDEVNIAAGPYTMSTWVRAENTNGDNMIFGQVDNGNVLHNGIRAANYHIGHWGNDITGGSVVVGEWAHVTYRFEENGTQTIFVNGVAVETAPDKGGAGVDAEIVIGAARGDQDRDLSGDLDDVRIYNEALTDLQIIALAASTSIGGDGGGGDPGGDAPSISDVVRADGGALSFGFPAGTAYDVEYSTDLINWSVVASDVSGTYTEADAGRNGETQGYYRGVAN